MRITRIEIRNFRSIRQLAVDLGETTVFIGPNNVGKTAILHALRIALTRRWGQRGTGFTEYDVHLENDTSDPKTSAGVSIELRTEESKPGDWPDVIQQDLDQIVQLDPVTGVRSITLRARCAWSDEIRARLGVPERRAPTARRPRRPSCQPGTVLAVSSGVLSRRPA